jgi:hypothetical protein
MIDKFTNKTLLTIGVIGSLNGREHTFSKFSNKVVAIFEVY